MKIVKMILAITIFLSLTACGEAGFEGKYEAAMGMQQFNFKSDGHMVQSVRGNKVAEFRFEREGDEIKVYMSDDVAQIFTIKENGDLAGPAGIKLTLVE